MVIYESRVVNISNLLVSPTLESIGFANNALSSIVKLVKIISVLMVTWPAKQFTALPIVPRP